MLIKHLIALVLVFKIVRFFDFLDLVWFLPVRFCFAPILAQVKNIRAAVTDFYTKTISCSINIWMSFVFLLTYSPSEGKLGL